MCSLQATQSPKGFGSTDSLLRMDYFTVRKTESEKGETPVQGFTVGRYVPDPGLSRGIGLMCFFNCLIDSNAQRD